MAPTKRQRPNGGEEETPHTMASDYAFASRFTAEEIPKYELSKQGMPANIAAQLIAEERMLDKTPVSATARYERSSPSRSLTLALLGVLILHNAFPPANPTALRRALGPDSRQALEPRVLCDNVDGAGMREAHP